MALYKEISQHKSKITNGTCLGISEVFGIVYTLNLLTVA
jgi:hypothetical protein